MLFHSLVFIGVFLPVTLLVFYALARSRPARVPLYWLMVASLFFYSYWNPPYVLLLLGSILVNFLIGRALARQPSRALLVMGVAANLAVIGYYKYGNFFLGTIDAVAGTGWSLGQVFLPLGISFFTFQQIAFLVDAHRGRARTGSFADYALFVSFFPQLIAGPIVHHGEMMPQFARRDAFRPQADNFALGLGIFTFGLIKKVLIADGVATYADPVFAAAHAGLAPTLFEAWGGALAYTFQLYFDFSGYSDMAIGLARMFNIRLPLNFNSPYKAVNIIDFWRRWNMTLSRFLRDYLYIPLGGSRRGRVRRYINLMITMLLGGLWHGAGWTFVVWGGLHGLYLVVNHFWHALRRALGQDPDRSTAAGRVLARALTFLVVVVAWVPFRAESFDASATLLAGMFGLNGIVVPEAYFQLLGPLGPLLAGAGVEFRYVPGFLFDGMPEAFWIAAVAAIAFLAPNTQQWFGLVEWQGPRLAPRLERLASPLLYWRAHPLQAIGMGGAFAVLLLMLYSETPRAFLYFQF